MPEYDAMAGILGKTIKGVIVKENTKGSSPQMSVHLVFTDGTSYEIYSLYRMGFAGGLDKGDIDKVRQYGIAQMGPMENVLDISIDKP